MHHTQEISNQPTQTLPKQNHQFLHLFSKPEPVRKCHEVTTHFPLRLPRQGTDANVDIKSAQSAWQTHC
jgi:hypothetical protein